MAKATKKTENATVNATVNATKKVTINKCLKQALKTEKQSLIKELFTLNKVAKATLEELNENRDNYSNFVAIIEHLGIKSHKDLVKIFKKSHRFQTVEGALLKKSTYYIRKNAKECEKHTIFIEIERFSISMVLNSVIRAYRQDKVSYETISERPSEGTISLSKAKEKGLKVIS